MTPTTDRLSFLRKLEDRYKNLPIKEVESEIKERALAHGFTTVHTIPPDAFVTADMKPERLRILCCEQNGVVVVSGFG